MLSYQDLFEYYKKERTKIIAALEKLPNSEFVKNRELSFDSIKNVFAHTVMVEDNWLHYRAAGIPEGGKIKFDDFKNLVDIKRYISEVDAKTEKMFSKMTDQDLARDVKRTTQEGKVETIKLEHILYHIPIEIIHHFGEIFAEFWKMNIDAPYYSYLTHMKDRRN